MAAKDFSDVVLQPTKDQEKEDRHTSFSERLKKIRQNRNTRRNISAANLSSTLDEGSTSSPLLDISRSLGTLPVLPPPSIPPLTLPTVEEASPKHELVHRDSFGIYLMNGKEDKQNKEEEEKEKETIETKKTSPEVTMKDGRLVSIVGDHLYEIPEPLPLKQKPKASPSPPAIPRKTRSPSPPVSPDDTLGPPPSLPSSPPPTLPSSPPPPIPLSLDDDIDQSLSPNIYPGDVQFTASDDVFIEGTFPLASTETPATETPPTGRESPAESYEEDGSRRRSVMSTTSAQDLHFKPTLKKWGVVNLNELNGTPPSSYDDGRDGEYFKSLGTTPGYHNRSYSGISRVSGGGVEMSLESITELTDPALPPQLVQEKLTSNNLKEGDIDVKEVGKASWRAKKPPVLEPVMKSEDEFKTVSACQLTGTNYENDNDKVEAATVLKEKKEVLPPVKILGKEEEELARQNEMKERERQKHLLAMEGEGEEEEEEEREGRGKKQKKGNLERLNQDDIPHSTSSFFDAVVSDIPGLTEDKEEDKGGAKEGESVAKKKVEPLHVYELVQQDEGYEFMQPRPPPTPARSATFSSGTVSPPVSPSTVSSSPPLSPTSLSPPLSPTGGVGAKSDGRQAMLKLHMHTVHPGVMYKMFRVSDNTTVLDLVSMALKKANLIEDPHSYTIYNIQTTNKAIVQSIKDGDYVLPYLNRSKQGTQWDLRRKRDTKTVEIIIDVNGASKNSVSLFVSPQTTSQEVTLLLSRKLGLTIPKGKENPYRILLVHDGDTDERMVGSDSPLLYSRSSSTSSSSSTDRFKMVDIIHYLTKEGDPSTSTESAAAPKPKDFESAKIILQQSHERFLELQKELVVKGYTIQQTERNFEETRQQNDTLQTQMDTLQSDMKTYQEKNKVLTQTVEELHETLSVLTSKNKELTNSVSVLSRENDKMNEEHQKDELTIAKLHQAMNEASRVSKEEKDRLKCDYNLLEEERDRLLKQIEENKTQPHDKAIPNTNSSRSLYSLLTGRVQNLLVSIQLRRTPDEGLGIMLINNPSGRGCIVKNVTESSLAHGTLLAGDRLLEVNGEDVSDSNHKDILKVLERQLTDGTVQIVVCRDNFEGEGARDGDGGDDIEQLKEECLRLQAQLAEAHSLLNENELLLQEREEQIERTKSQLLPSKDIDSLKKQILENQQSIDKSESLADTLKDASQEELLDALRTVEADCLRNKESLDRLFALIVGHTPELLSVMAEVQQPEGDDVEDGSDFDDEDIDTSSPASPSPPPVKTGGWC